MRPPRLPLAATSADGLWTGTSDDGRTIAGAVLDDGTYWFLYSAVGNPSVVAGAFQGNGEGQYGTFTSSNGRDFYLERAGQFDATVTARYVMRQSFNGILTYSTVFGTSSFTSTFSPEYDRTPNLTPVAGTYTGSITSLLSSHSFTVTVSDSGAFALLDEVGPAGSGGTTAGIITGCGATGTLSPRAQGNVYDITFTHTGNRGFCHAEPYTGVAVFDVTANRLYILALDSNRRKVFPFMGTKQ